MNCFFNFKSKTKSTKKKKAESAPELRNQDHSDNSAVARSTKSLPSPRRISEIYQENEQSSRVFSFRELAEATQGFNRMLKIGEGGFGSVYKGMIRPADGRGELVLVAVKKLKTDSLQGHKEWLAEVQFLGVVDHPNLVKLLGYCCEDGERGIRRLLVYEYMPNRSFEDHLFGKTASPLPWKKRLEIIHGAADGLAYLHEGLEQKVIFRDFKTSNILLDEAFNPKLSDFGLAREGPTGDRSHVSTAVVGTYGYAAPEYVETGHLTLQCDIWSFGVVLFEILTGRRALDRNRPMKEQKLIDWVKRFPIESHSFSIIMDPRLRNQYSLQAAKKIARLANSCLNKNPKQRPAMSEVKEVLRQALEDS